MHRKFDGKSLGFYAFVIIYFGALIYLCAELNIWEDEAYSLHTTSNNLSTVISQSYNFEGQPPFYFLLLAIWRHINSGIFFARLLSIIFIALSSVTFYKLIHLISGKQFSRWMLIIFLLNPFTVWAALEIRLYALAIFLSIILIYYFFLFYIENKNKHLYLFLVIALIGLYTQYFFILEISALTLSLLVFKGWKVFLRFSIHVLLLALLFIPNLFFINQQVGMLQSHRIEYSTAQRFSAVLHTPQELLLGLEIVPFKVTLNRIIRAIFLLIALYAYYKAYKQRSIDNNSYFRNINIVFLTAAVSIFLYCILIAVTGIIFQMKYFAIIYPLIFLTITLFKVYPSFTGSFIYAVISIYYVALNIVDYQNPIKNFDFKSAGKFVNKIEHTNEPILLYDKSLLPPFTYYYSGSNPLVSLPAINYNNHYYEENIFDTVTFKKMIEKIKSTSNSYILITDNSDGYKYNLDMSQQMIDDCLKSNYNISYDTSFLGSNERHILRIRRLEIK